MQQGALAVSTLPAKPLSSVRREKISIRGLTKVYGDSRSGEVVAFEGISLSVREAEFLCLLGPSGCGKTTLLMTIAGFERPTSGEVRVDDEVVSGPGQDRGIVFQEYALFPWRTVRQNVTYGLEIQGLSKAQRLEIANRFLDLVGLSEFADHYPFQLSGGMKQRVAIARSLAVNPAILLMDEPFGALDALTRSTLQKETERIWKSTQKTIVFVTHNVHEAIVLGDRVIVFTARPARIKGEFPIPLGRPRNSLSPEFVSLRGQIEAVMRDELADSQGEVGE